MIFLTVGTQKFQFNRLLKMVDELIGHGVIKDTVFAQIGYCDYTPINYEYENFLDKETFDYYVSSCNVLIAHSGVGTIITGINSGKPVIVVPRKAELGEHVDNHQFDIANSFFQKKYILLASNEKELENAINKVTNFHFEEYISGNDEIATHILKYIRSI